MAEYALRLTNGTDTAPRVRVGDAVALQHNGPLAARSGLRPDGGGVVSAVAGTMQVQVTAFSGWVDGGVSLAQGGYPFVLDATKTLTLTDGDAVLERVDTIAAVVSEDAYDASGDTSAELLVVQGTPGAGAPVLPTSALPLRDVTVPAGLSAGTGGLSSANIGTDRRAYLSTGTVPVSGVTERDALGAQAGQTVYRADAGTLELFDGTEWVAFKRDDGLLIQRGTQTIELVSTAGATETATFPQPFSGAPTVTATTDSGTYFAAVTSVPTATAVDLRAQHRDGNSLTNTVKVYWIAVGPA